MFANLTNSKPYYSSNLETWVVKIPDKFEYTYV